MNSETKGNNFLATKASTPVFNIPVKTTTTGPIAKNPSIANIIPNIPIEKLLTSISKPDGIFPSTTLSNFLITKPANGPIIIAPINIGISAPTITPIVATVPITPPLAPPTILPPV